ncbi:hypothetical protein ACA910_011269 [Epithemia clementina (nom. ined.)]
MSPRTIHLAVDGMMCQRNCGSTVATALSTKVEGAAGAKADFGTKTAWVRTSSTNDEYQNAIAVVEAVGFEARPAVHLQVTGMMCQKNCGTTVANALKGVEGVHDATAIFSESRAIVALRQDSNVAHKLPQLVDAVEAVGFNATVIPDIQTYLDKNEGLSSRPTTSLHDAPDDSSTSLLQEMVHLRIPKSQADRTIVLGVGGMSCAVCTGRVESCLKGTSGVVDATVILSTQRALVELSHDARRDIIVLDCCDAVQRAGYTCIVVEQSPDLRKDAEQLEQARQDEEAYWFRLFIFSAILTIPMVVLATGLVMIAPSEVPSGNLWIVCISSTIVQLVVGKRYYIAAWKGWAHGGILGMDFLVVLGTTASYVYSIVLFMEQLLTDEMTDLKPSFMAGAMLLTFVTLGKYLESYARGKTADAVHKLMELQPSCASRVIGFPREEETDTAHCDISALTTEEVLISDIQPGDYVRVLPGGSIPADGVLVAISSKSSGSYTVQEAFIDESAFSGEPFPVAKRIGDSVHGSTVNQLSALVVRVTASGSDTFLSKIVRLVEDAQRHKAPIQAYADTLACVFVPAVVGVATMTFMGWMLFGQSITIGERFNIALMSSIAVIVVACPCALGLATPTAVMVGTGVGATQGVLIKGGAVLEHMHTINTVIFDKTGTLTCGKAKLSDRIEYLEKDEILKQNLPSLIPADKVALWLAVCAEAQSEHPLAQAIVNAAKEAWLKDGDETDLTGANEGVRVDDFCVQPGRGVECSVSKPEWGHRIVRVGSKEWSKEPLDSAPRKEDCTGDKDADFLRHQGKIAIYLSVLDEGSTSRRVIAVFGVVDPLKPEAFSTVAALQKHGIDVWMCTGDDIVTALAVGRSIGIPDCNICAGVTPEGKADLVTRLQRATDSGLQLHSRSKNTKSKKNQRGNVAMVADGVNDSIALARADVGIAIGAGREIALEAADVVLVRSNLHDVVVAFHLSSVVFRRILLNFVLALCYNIVAVPFAAGLFDPMTDFHLPPALAGFMMACSSVSVVTSSLLLRRYQRPIVREDGSLKVTKGWLEVLTHGIGLHRIGIGQGYVGCEADDSGEVV